MYEIKIIAGDNCANDVAFLSVYDEGGEFTAGGGWIQSPDNFSPYKSGFRASTGKIIFGFMSAFFKGSNEVGSNEFRFVVSDLNFRSSSGNSASLVFANHKAIYKGTGTINGSGEYDFMVTATDGQINGGGGTDKLRIKIWDKNKANGISGIIFDNQPGSNENSDATTELSGGSIVIGTKSKIQNTSFPIENPPGLNFEGGRFIGLKAYPNPVQDLYFIRLENPFSYEVRLRLISLMGRQMPLNIRERSNQFYALDLTELQSGIYFLNVQFGDAVHNLRLVKQE